MRLERYDWWAQERESKMKEELRYVWTTTGGQCVMILGMIVGHKLSADSSDSMRKVRIMEVVSLKMANLWLPVPSYTDAVVAIFDKGKGRISLDDVKCEGSEANLLSCPQLSLTLTHNCNHEEDVGVQC